MSGTSQDNARIRGFVLRIQEGDRCDVATSIDDAKESAGRGRGTAMDRASSRHDGGKRLFLRVETERFLAS